MNFMGLPNTVFVSLRSRNMGDSDKALFKKIKREKKKKTSIPEKKKGDQK